VGWPRRLLNTFRAGRVEREIERELAFHLAERADALRAEGLSDDEAARRARAQVGNPLLQAERTRDADVVELLDAGLRNLRHSARSLAREPGFAATVVLTLALGIGANTAVFSALDAVLLRPLPYPEADRLVRLFQKQDATAETAIAPVRLEDWNRMNASFLAITGYMIDEASETSGDLPERVRRAFVTPRFIEVWGVRPARGRGFTADEHRAGGPPAALISDRYWRLRFGASPDVLGRSLQVGSAAVPIVGVMPASFRFPERGVDMWFPVPVDAPYAQSRLSTWYSGVGRLRAGVTLDQARSDLAAVQARLARQFPDTDRKMSVELVPLKQMAVGRIGPSLWLLFGAVSVLLLIACTNVAALLLSRGTQRRHELAIRLSLGASPAAVAAHVLGETLLLALAGGTLGLLTAWLATSSLRSWAAGLPRVDEIATDGGVLAYCMAATLGVALLCGLLPATRAARDRGAGLAGAPERTLVSTRHSLQWALVGAQVALSVTLLAGAGLLVRSIRELARVEPGFDGRRVLSFRMSGSWSETGDYPALLARIDRTLEELRGLPGVEAAATTGWTLPGVPAQWESTLDLAEANADAGRRIVAEFRAVSPEYFATLRIPLLAGALCERRQVRPGSGGSGWELSGWDLMVNRAFAARYLADFPSPMGLHLTERGRAIPGRVVGVVGDARERGLDREPPPTVYACLSAPGPSPYFLVRTSTEPLAIARQVRARMKELEPLRSVYDVGSLAERIDEAFGEGRLLTLLLSLFALTALSLAGVGLYGTLSYLVSLRRREVGLRIALGALWGDVVRQFVAQGMRVAIPACVCGLGLALALRRVVAGLLFGVSATDPVTLAGVVVLVLGVSSFASLLPAARAARTEPMRVLRES
jgi:putative ABC transport system permease protein